MKISKIAEILKAEILTDFSDDIDVKYGFASDLMSDVLRFANKESVMLITGLNNQQVIRTAEMLDLTTVVFVRGKKPSKEIIDLSNENKVTILATDYTMFKTCGLLVMNGMKGIEQDD